MTLLLARASRGLGGIGGAGGAGNTGSIVSAIHHRLLLFMTIETNRLEAQNDFREKKLDNSAHVGRGGI